MTTKEIVNMTRMRSREREQRRLINQLKATVQCYELALRESNVTVFTQDRDLRYTSISHSMIGDAAVDITKRKENEAHMRLLLRELTHRSKNLLTVILALERQTARHTNSIADFVAHFDARLQALATSHDVLIAHGWYGVSLRELAQSQLHPFVGSLGRQVSFQGPTVVLTPEAAQALGLALHELANNARKFGALSMPEGHVSVSWSRRLHSDGGSVEFKWAESGGPAVVAPVTRRFGSMVIERNLESALAGKVKLAFLAAGVQCRILIPPEHLVGFVDRQIA